VSNIINAVWMALAWTGAFVFLLAYLCWREHCHAVERRELYSRLMARDLPEFAALQDRQKPPKGRSFIRLPTVEQREGEE